MIPTTPLRLALSLLMSLMFLVSGMIRAEEMNLTGNLTVDGNTALNGNLAVDATTLKVDATSHNVGIGTASPASKLQVYGASNNDKVIFGYDSSTGTPISGYTIQTKLGGANSTGYNGNANGSIKLYIGNYDNDGTTVYPIYAEDENTGTYGPDFYIKNRNVSNSAPIMFFSGYFKLGNISDPGWTTQECKVFSNGGVLWASDTSNNHSVFSPHYDPRQVNPMAQTSFSDQTVSYPFSMYHKNPLLGKEQAIDMAKMAAWVEKKMKAELGEEAGALVFTRDLPTSQCLSLSQFQAQQVLDKLEKLPWIKVAVSAGGQIPDAAFEEVPEIQEVEKKVTVTKKEIDFATRRLVDVTREEFKMVQEATGRTIARLKAGWELREDGVYRKPALDDVNIETLLAEAPNLPQWIMNRIKTGQQAGLDIDTLTGEIRQILAAKAPAAVETAAGGE